MIATNRFFLPHIIAEYDEKITIMINSLQVNKRLAGDKTEDPNFPKIQFPTAAACPHCMTPKALWDEDTVSCYPLMV